MSRKPGVGPLMICVLVTLATLPAHAADGNELFAYGAIQKGLGGAGAAHAFDATWIMLNPAGLARLEQRIDLGMELMRVRLELDPRGIPLASNVAAGHMSDTSHIGVPQTAGVVRVGKGALGLGFFGTQGNRVNFAHPRSTLGLIGNGDRRSQFEVVKAPIVYALPIGERWSVALGIVPTLGRFRSDSLTLRLREVEAENAYDFEDGIGLTSGIEWRGERLRLGAAYHSRVWMGRYEAYSKDLFTSNFDLPQKIQAGAALNLGKGVEVLVDFKWIDWPSIDQLGRKTERGGLAWEDQRLVKAGINWDINERWSIRGGVQHGKSPVTERSAFANALTPGISETTVAVGASWRINARHEFHAAYSHVFPNFIRDNGQGDFFSLVGQGTGIGYREDSLTIQYTWHF